MSDSPFPINDRPDQESAASSTSRAGQQSNYNPPDGIGRTSDPQDPIEISPSEPQTVGSQPNRPAVDRPMDAPPRNMSISSSGSVDDIVETWFTKDVVDEMRSRWNAIQVQFVDSPCAAVEQGDALVGEIMERYKQILTDQQNSLNQQWLSQDDITTEELRITLLNYRSLLNYLLKL